MNKKEFLTTLENGIKTLPKIEKERIYNFYHETLEDRIEEGLNEEEAVNSMEDVKSIIAEALCEYQIQDDKEVVVKKRRGIRYALLICASPFIFTFLCLLLSIYFVFWSLFASLICILVALILFLIVGIIYTIRTLRLNFASGIVLVGCLLFTAGACPWIYKLIKVAYKALKQLWIYGIEKIVCMWKKAVE